MASRVPLEEKNGVRKRLTFDDITPTNSSPTLGVTPLPDTTSDPLENQNDPNHNEIKIIDFSNLTDQEKYEKMAKWNFDFHNEVPLEGKWEWERVEPPRIVDHKEKVCALGQKESCRDRNV